MDHNHMLHPAQLGYRDAPTPKKPLLGPPQHPLPIRQQHHSVPVSLSPLDYSHPSLSMRNPTAARDDDDDDAHPALLPSTNKLPPLAHHDRDDKMLPSLSTITGSHAFRGGDLVLDQKHMAFHQQQLHHQHQHQHHHAHSHSHSPMPYRQLPPQSHPSPAAMDIDMSSSMASTPSPDRHHESTSSSITLDDPDVRLAAEALGDLRADFISSPPDTTGALSPAPQFGTQVQSSTSHSHPEPLLSLLTTSHPLIASTVGGASSAYGGVKNFSPRFKSGAEYVEGYLTPLAKTVNSVGRKTGVEGGVRWFLGGNRRPSAPTSDPDGSINSKKRRKFEEEPSGLDDLHDSTPPTPKSARRLSSTSTIDTLPAYDEVRSPAYTESAVVAQSTGSQLDQTQAWQTRLLMTTSGLSVAMSSESLRSLKYCLRWLRWTNDHMGRTISSLKAALEDYEKTTDSNGAGTNGPEQDDSMTGVEGGSGTKTPEEARTEMANHIQTVKGDILKTLQDVVTNVSKYAGGGLPDNARVLVRRHLTSLPQRFRLATMSESEGDRPREKDSDSALRERAQKVLVLAKEGLDMVTQISGVLDGTIVSAEEWCERMGKKRDSTSEAVDVSMSAPMPETSGDVKMG